MTGGLKSVSAIILAGGRSSRMGTSKAELRLGGDTLLEYQVKKVRALGIEDVVLSGYQKPVEGARPAADIYPGRGPLSGIHAGLLAAANPHCLVLSVDAPLVPQDTLLSLIGYHTEAGRPITILTHNGKKEPLIGVYDRSLSAEAEDILKTDSTSVRVLFDRVGAAAFEYGGDEALLFNCNTPEEYSLLLQYAAGRR